MVSFRKAIMSILFVSRGQNCTDPQLLFFSFMNGINGMQTSRKKRHLFKKTFNKMIFKNQLFFLNSNESGGSGDTLGKEIVKYEVKGDFTSYLHFSAPSSSLVIGRIRLRKPRGSRFSLTEMKMLSRFSSVGSCGISFWTTLLKASNIEWSYMLVK